VEFILKIKMILSARSIESQKSFVMSILVSQSIGEVTFPLISTGAGLRISVASMVYFFACVVESYSIMLVETPRGNPFFAVILIRRKSKSSGLTGELLSESSLFRKLSTVSAN
jgi:hypothetical protein